MKHAVVRADGSVSVMEIFDQSATPDTEIAKWLPVDQATVSGHHPVGALPDRRWRNAWVSDGTNLLVDLVKARAVRRLELQRLRDAALDQNNANLEAAVDNGLTILAAAIRARRIRLRALEATIDPLLAAAVDLPSIAAVTSPDL